MKFSIVVRSVMLWALVLGTDAMAETRWFVVSEIDPTHGDSYLLPLTDDDDIQQARTLIEQGPDGEVGSIASVQIAAGPDGFNRDVLAEGQPLWSWHVTEFEGFSDFAIELCDGWPGFVEQNVQAFIDNTDGRICFWGYTVTAELEEAPEFEINAGLSGGWFNPDTPGQGLMLDVFTDMGEVFAAWFTFDETAAKLGAPEHRWLTAQGPYQTDLATLDLTLTTGGRFDDPAPVENSEPGAVGTLTIQFENCNHGNVTYDLVAGPAGAFPIRRLVPIEGCEPPGDDTSR